jgi:2-keto-3-deoxy-L-arabinonate dehydratase
MSKPEPEFRGVYALPVTPFLEDGSVDERSLISEIEFCIEAKADGIALPLMAGEFHTLTEAERLRIAEIAVSTAAKRIPVIVGCSGGSTTIAVEIAQHAESIGADGVIALPPYIVPEGYEGVKRHFQALRAKVNIPIFIQNPTPPFGNPMAPDMLIRLAQEVGIEYVKDEGLPPAPRLKELMSKGQGYVKGIFGGMGGKWFLSQLELGGCGIMPACHLTDVLAQVYEHYTKGDEHQAREIFFDLLPIFNLDGSGKWLQIAKEILVRRGIITTAVLRSPSCIELDSTERSELEMAIQRVSKWFTVV